MHSLTTSQIDHILSLIDAQHSAHQILVIIHLLSLDSGLNTVLILSSLRVTAPLDFLLPMSAMHFALLTLERLTIQLKSPKCFVTSPIKTFHLKLFVNS